MRYWWVVFGTDGPVVGWSYSELTMWEVIAGARGNGYEARETSVEEIDKHGW